ncbi:FAD-binding and (Fe-S)-binding domain-containing protein [Actinomyces sp. F1_1611]
MSLSRAEALRSGGAAQELYRRVWAHDASHFLVTPREVRQVDSAAQMAELFREARRRHLPVTFRSGGTSLNGQAQSEGILVDTRAAFKAVVPLDRGHRVWVQPGVTIRQVNRALARHGRKMGPDPASEIAATVGGVLANNASGMLCGTDQNSYRLIESLEVVLPSGTILNTADPGAADKLAELEPNLVDTLTRLRDQLWARPDLVAEVRRQFSQKNTMGYSLNAFLDYSEPLDLLVHLLVGSEGTLGLVSEAVYRTVPVRPHAATALWLFPDVHRAAEAIAPLVGTGVAALELMDARALAVAQNLPHPPAELVGLDLKEQAALLVEYQEESEADLAEALVRAQTVPAAPSFTTDSAVRAHLWAVRKGLYASVAGASSERTLLEDIAVPVPALADTTRDLSNLLERFDYRDAVIFGHAKDGNLHFMLSDDFGSDRGRQRLEAFTEELVELVLSRGGALKAEHGTGRAMAPFVERQYGPELYRIMRDLKSAFDPDQLCNPGVILTDDPHLHLRSLKETPAVNPLVDRCVECGYCEPSCPSHQLTLTPRTRIVAEREIALARQRGDRVGAKQLEQAFEYAAVDTCAVDGLCEVACPLDINTGDLVREQRRQRSPRWFRVMWALAARHWSAVTVGAALALSVAQRLPASMVTGITRMLRAIVGPDRVPLWTADLPGGGRRRSKVARYHRNTGPVEAVYLPSCLNAMFAPAPLDGSSGNTQLDFQLLCEQAGVTLRFPPGLDRLCCATPWTSKGQSADRIRSQVRAALEVATEGGRLPVVCDNSSCTEGLVKFADGYRVLDAPVFLRDVILPRLPAGQLRVAWHQAALHPTCSTTHLGSTEAVRQVAQQVVGQARVPDDWGCCGFAGDRGMLHPELTAAATEPEAADVQGVDLRISTNRTCEIGMTRATGQEYVALISAVAVASGATDPDRAAGGTEH